MPFEKFVAEIQKLAEADGATDPGKPYCGADAWRSAYEEGMSAQDAWDEEKSAAATMIG